VYGKIRRAEMPDLNKNNSLIKFITTLNERRLLTIGTFYNYVYNC